MKCSKCFKKIKDGEEGTRVSFGYFTDNGQNFNEKGADYYCEKCSEMSQKKESESK